MLSLPRGTKMVAVLSLLEDIAAYRRLSPLTVIFTLI
jgi:hypothetical protein